MGHGIGVWMKPLADGTVQLAVSQSLYVACEVAGWIAAVVAGLVTAKLVLP